MSISQLDKSISIGSSGLDIGGSSSSESQILKEMQKNGMEMPQASAGETLTTFSDAFRNSLDGVNTAQVQADTAIKELMSGRTKNIHETLLAVEKADSSLKLMMQVRNKVLDAYKEIMRMQV